MRKPYTQHVYTTERVGHPYPRLERASNSEQAILLLDGPAQGGGRPYYLNKEEVMELRDLLIEAAFDWR